MVAIMVQYSSRELKKSADVYSLNIGVQESNCVELLLVMHRFVCDFKSYYKIS